MAYYVPEGAKFYFSETFESAKSVTAITNANPAVATSVGHGYSDNDELLFESGWEDASDTIWRADQLTADTFSLLGLDSTDTTWFAAGTGTGTVQKVSNWVEIPQVLGVNTQGGDAKFTDISPLARRNSIRKPIGFNAATITLTLGHDASNANYQTMVSISRRLAKVAIKMVLPGSATAYAYGSMIVSEVPSLQSSQVNQVQCAISADGRMISYYG